MATVNRWSIKKMKLEGLHVAKNNPREMRDRAFQGLRKSIARFGLVEPIVWNERTGRIIGGHQRYRALVEDGVTEALVLVVDLDEKDELAANLTLNNPEIEGEFEEPIFDLLTQLKEQDESMFRELGMGTLERELQRSLGTTAGTGTDDSGVANLKSKCPCCGHEWEVGVSDVSIEESK
jgi:hypothetical protein